MKPLRLLGYSAFFCFSFVVGLYLTFPWPVVEERLLHLASKGSFLVTSESMSPSGPTSFRFRNVTVTHRAHPDAPMVIDELWVRAHIVPLLRRGFGASIEARFARGELSAVVSQTPDQLSAEIDAQGLTLDFVPLLGAITGLPLSGQVGLQADVSLARAKGGQSAGQARLETKGLVVEKGAKLGMFPLPMAVALGDLALDFPIKDSKIAFANTELKGTDLEAKLDGTINLETPLDTTNLNLTVGLMPSQKFLAANQLIGPLLNNFSQYKSGDGFYRVAMKGNIQRPIVSPVRAGR